MKNDALDYYEYVDCFVTIELALMIGEKHKGNKHRAVKYVAKRMAQSVTSPNIKAVMLNLAYQKMPYTYYQGRVKEITKKFTLMDFINVGYAYKTDAIKAQILPS